MGTIQTEFTCPRCKGRGWSALDMMGEMNECPCELCKGKKLVTDEIVEAYRRQADEN